MSNFCLECESNLARFRDPREPPLEEAPCLCAGCFVSAAEVRIDELKDECDELNEEIKKAIVMK